MSSLVVDQYTLVPISHSIFLTAMWPLKHQVVQRSRTQARKRSRKQPGNEAKCRQCYFAFSVFDNMISYATDQQE